MEFQFLHDDNWGHEAVIRERGAAEVVKRHLAEFARARGTTIYVTERYDLPTYSVGAD